MNPFICTHTRAGTNSTKKKDKKLSGTEGYVYRVRKRYMNGGHGVAQITDPQLCAVQPLLQSDHDLEKMNSKG